MPRASLLPYTYIVLLWSLLCTQKSVAGFFSEPDKCILHYHTLYVFWIDLVLNSSVYLTTAIELTLRLLMSYIYIYIYIYMEHLFLMFLDHTQRRTTVGRTPLDE